MFADRTRQGTVLLLLGVVVLLQQQTHVAAQATCKLHLEGFGNAHGIKSAQLSCSGGTITASAHPVLLANFNRTFSGVQWSSDGDCAIFAKYCLLALCGDTSATFPSAIVHNVNVSRNISRLLCLSGSSNVTFDAALFEGNAGRPVSVLSNNVKLHIRGSNFTQNKLLWMDAGGEVVTGGSFHRWVTSTLDDSAGGALQLSGGITAVESSVFYGNAALNSGGAVAVGKSASLQLSSTLFKSNTAAESGGGVYVEGTLVSVRQCTFTSNTATFGAGLALYGSDETTVSNSNITFNHAERAGGAIYVTSSAKLNITRSVVLGNTASMHGGGIGVWDKATAYIDKVIVKDNSVQISGGGLSVGGTTGVVVQDALFQNNTSNDGCGAMYVYENGTAKIMHTQLALNSALGSSGGGGVGVWGNATMAVVDTNITNNTAMYAGGIDIEEHGTLYVESSVLSGNTAKVFGGGMYAVDNCTVVVMGCTLAHNSANEKDGGAIYASNNSKVAIFDSTLRSNQARFGGAIFCSNNSVHVEGCHIFGNSASSFGGGVALEGNGTCIMDACTLDANYASSGGAAWVAQAPKFALRDCVFHSNVATDYGGGVHVAGETQNVTMYGCHFLNNTARQEGGAICLSLSSAISMVGRTWGAGNNARSGGFASVDKSARLEVTGGVFQRNYANANGRGGLMYVNEDAKVVLRACDIQGKVAQPDVFGGAFNLEGKARLELLSCTMSHLHASRGGAIGAFTNSSFLAHNTSVFNCTASNEGGGVFTSSFSHQSWLGGSFRSVQAKEGGAFYIFFGTLDVSDTVLVNGTAPDGGGALHVTNSSRVVLKRCTIQGCKSGNSGGGGLLVNGGAEVALLNTNISNCHTDRGGGAIAGHDNATLFLKGCFLQRNTGIVCGGAVHLENTARMVAADCSVVENVCEGKGGGMCALEDTSFTLRQCVVSRNVADRGAGVWLEGKAAMVLQNTGITNNTARSFGGGVMLYSSNFSLAELQASVRNNKAPITGKDVTVIPTTITNTNKSTVEGFVSRLGTDAGLLNVTLRVTGVRGLPAESTTVHALVDGLVVDNKKSGANGMLNMLIKLRKPPGTYQVMFALPGGDNPPTTRITVHVVNCGLGDVTSVTGDACYTCERGYYSLDPRNNTCDICVPNAECVGGANITATSEFWQSSPRNTQMHRCLNPEACPGRNNIPSLPVGDHHNFKSSQCAEGYMGNLCGQCDVQAGYGTVKPFTCKPCMKPVVTIVLYSVAALVMLVAVRVMSALALADSGSAAPDQPRPCDLIKPLVLYAQYLFIITNINGVPWPKPVSVVVQALSFFWSSTSSNSLGLDCVLRSTAALPVAMQKTLFSLLMPLAMLFVLLLLDVFWSLRCQRARRGARIRGLVVNTKDEFLSLCVCMAFLFLPTWLHVAFSLFTCIALDVPASFPYEAAAVGSYLAADMSEQCYKLGGYHRAWALGLGVPLLVLFCLVVPVGLYVFLWLSRKRGKLGDDNFRKHFGFLYRTWREDVCWWEAVTCCQTICLVAIGTFGHVLGVYFQSLVILAALGTIFVLMLLVRPHKCQVAFVVTLFSVWVLITTAFSALTFLSYQKVTPAYGYTMAMGVFVLVINITFVLSTLLRLVRLVQWGIVRRWCGCCSATPPCCGPCEPCRQLHRRAGSWLDDLGMSRMGAAAVAMAGGCWACMPTVLVPTPPLESAKGRDRSRGKDPDVSDRGQQQEQQQEPVTAAAENEC